MTKLGEVALLFLRLGFTAFGGPAAHVAIMEDEVDLWCSEARSRESCSAPEREAAILPHHEHPP